MEPLQGSDPGCPLPRVARFALTLGFDIQPLRGTEALGLASSKEYAWESERILFWSDSRTQETTMANIPEKVTAGGTIVRCSHCGGNECGHLEWFVRNPSGE